MTSSTDQVIATLRSLVDAFPEEVPWALIGGLAVSSRAEPRFTRDVDVAIAVSDDQAAEAVTAHVTRSGWTLAGLVEHDQVGRLAQVRLLPPFGVGVTGDLLFASSGIEAEVADAAELLEIVPHLQVPVSRVGHLIALKLLSVDAHRHQDRMDLDALAAVATAEDWRLADEGVALITQRGFHRDRDLAQALGELRHG